MSTSFSKDIVPKTLESWLTNVADPHRHVRLFERVRDIPYEVVPEICSHDNGPRGILLYGAGSCSPKHFLLGNMLEMLDIEVRYVSYPFFWQHQRLPYPSVMQQLSKDQPVEYHLALECRIHDQWITMDATWDPVLIHAGFPGVLDWNGTTNTPLAVKAVDKIIHSSAVERQAFVQRQKLDRRLNAGADSFYGEMNKWFAALRSDSGRIQTSP